MIRLWLSRSSAVPLREQLCAQLILGIMSHQFTPGQRLPSVRELARWVKLHHNTVSAAYQDLVDRGWVTRRRGSGIYVNELPAVEPIPGVDAFVRHWIEQGVRQGFSVEAMRAALLQQQPHNPAGFLVVHGEKEFAEVLAAELSEALGCQVEAAALSPTECISPEFCLLTTRTHLADLLHHWRPAQYRLLELRSMAELLEQQRPVRATLLAVVSRSSSVREWTSKLIAALGLPDVEVLPRDPAKAGWSDGLSACGAIIADVLTAKELPERVQPIVLHLIAPACIAELRALVTAKKVS